MSDESAVIQTFRRSFADGMSHSWCKSSIIKALQPDETYYWATYNRAELDQLLFKNGRRIGVECKRADAPVLTPSMRIAMSDLRLDHLYVVYPGEKAYTLGRKIEVVR